MRRRFIFYAPISEVASSHDEPHSGDYIHIFIAYNPVHLIPKLVESVKSSSTNWIKREKLIGQDFS
jgi:Transposase IS200 like